MKQVCLENEFKIPIFIKSNIHNYLRNEFKRYRNMINDFIGTNTYVSKEVKNKLNILDDLMESILDSINEYNNGNLSESYEKIDNILNNHSKDLVINFFMIEKGKWFFRGRVSKNNLTPAELFHIPFSKRYLAESYRYSVLGLPCLYLGNSIQACWEELKRPDNRNLQFSAFQANQSIEIYDLSKTLQDTITFFKKHMCILLPPLFFELRNKGIKTYIAHKGEIFFLSKLPKGWSPSQLNVSVDIITDQVIDDFLREENMSLYELIDHIIQLLYINVKTLRPIYISDFIQYVKLLSKSIILHPLKMACSIKVENDSPYKPEYIISQHIMQWLRKNYKKQNIMGIKYLSTKLINNLNTNYDDRDLYVNYAFPVFEIDENSEYCNVLTNLFSVSKSKSITDLDVESIVTNSNNSTIRAKIYSENPQGNYYNTTYFHHLENTLKSNI